MEAIDIKQSVLKRIKKKFIFRNSESGQTIVESVLTLLILCLILFGLLQIFHLSIAQMLTDYSAFCTARSYSVGFDDYLVGRTSRVAAIGASGHMTYPEDSTSNSALELLAEEEIRIPEYIQGDRWLNYQYWHGNTLEDNEYDSRYWNTDGGGKYEVHAPYTVLSYSATETLDETVEVNTTFHNYPFIYFDLMDPGHEWFSREDAVDVTGSSEVMNYSANYLE